MTLEPSSEELGELIELAEVDTEIRRHRTQLDSLPEQRAVEAAEAEIAELERERADRTLDLDRAQAVAAKEDREVDQLRARLAAEQQRMYGGNITNPRELQSMRAEIEAVERRIDEHETAELEAMEEVEQFESQIASIDNRLEELRNRLGELAETRDDAAGAILAEIAELEVLRDRHRKPLSDELLARYDDALERFGGRALGRLEDDRCTACGISLSYADVNALMEGPPLTECPQCRRLMVVF